MNYTEYISASLAKSSTGASISVMLFAVVGIYACLGLFYGIRRGFSQSLIRFLTVAASAVMALMITTTISNTIVINAVGTGTEPQSLEALLNSYSPDLVGSMPEMLKPIVSELNSETATIFVMMFVSILITPVLYVALFLVLKFLTVFVYKILAGLTGAINYGKTPLNSLLGGLVGIAQGLLIAGVIILPIGGLCGLAVEAREPLLERADTPNEMIASAYEEYIDDLADNPLFELINRFDSNDSYTKMITVKIGDNEYNMGDECIGVIEIFVDILPITSDFDWKHPTDEQRQAFNELIDDLGKNDLITSLVSDTMRGFAACINNGTIELGLTGAPKTLVNEVMDLFATSTKETIVSDFRLFVDIYFIMCDRNLIDSFSGGNSYAIRDALTVRDANGNTAVDEIIAKLNSYERGQSIISAFTKLSITVMMGTSELDEDTQQLYEDVKEDIITVLNHNKSDFETEEEYKEAVSADLDKALADNNIEIEQEIKDSMVDYIADNYGDHEGEITDKEINDALLSYYKSYTDYINSGENPEDINPDDILGNL